MMRPLYGPTTAHSLAAMLHVFAREVATQAAQVPLVPPAEHAVTDLAALLGEAAHALDYLNDHGVHGAPPPGAQMGVRMYIDYWSSDDLADGEDALPRLTPAVVDLATALAAGAGAPHAADVSTGPADMGHPWSHEAERLHALATNVREAFGRAERGEALAQYEDAVGALVDYIDSLPARPTGDAGAPSPTAGSSAVGDTRPPMNMETLGWAYGERGVADRPWSDGPWYRSQGLGSWAYTAEQVADHMTSIYGPAVNGYHGPHTIKRPCAAEVASWAPRARGGFSCTRPAGHEGPHVGHNHEGEPVAVWASHE